MDIQKVYGLIGKSLTHSFSPKYFTEKFQKENINNTQYCLFELNEIKDFQELIQTDNLLGLNVTIPYKQTIIPFLDRLSEAAAKVNAVNCIQFNNNKLIGHNTDVIGFEKSLTPLLKRHHKKALILGTGGAAKAVAFVLEKLNIKYQFVSTKKSCEYLNYNIASFHLADFLLIINTTPIGMYPNISESPFNELIGVGQQHLVYDLIYNPIKTSLLQKAEQQDAQTKNGQEMLEIQAEESWKIWHG